jgi:multidrug resistance efflux pump
MVHVSPRFPGIVKSIAKRLGGVVKTGEALAVIESNESLQPYEVKSEIDGTIIKRDIALGEFVDTSKTIFIVADLSNVWVDFSVYRHESENLRVGQKVLFNPMRALTKSRHDLLHFAIRTGEHADDTGTCCCSK